MPPLRDALSDTGREYAIVRTRLTVSALLIVALLATLVYRYYSLQVINYAQYLTQSDNNRIRVQTVPPRRGLITDHKGRLLATNLPSYRLSVVLEETASLDQLLLDLGTLVELEADDIEDFKRRRRRRRPYEPVALKFALNEHEIAKLGVNLHRLDGAVIEAQLTRHYPEAELLSHVIGYVARISERDLENIEAEAYQGTSHIGKVGLERQYESVLHGQLGFQQVEANAHGQILRTIESEPPRHGADLQLYLDLDLQRVAAQALGAQRGAVVALDPRTGGVLAMVSNPGYDTNLFVNGISAQDYSALRDSPDVPLFNRVVQGQYPPGSTVKPMIALGALELGFAKPEDTVPDPGWYQITGDPRRYRDWILRIRGTGHAPEVDMRMAIAESCDVYYYDLARRMGIDNVASSLRPFGLGQSTSIDTTAEQNGLIPDSEWKKRRYQQPWYPGETLSAGIGQGYMLATPIQLAQAVSVLANRGASFEPSLVKRIGDAAVRGAQRTPVEASPDHWATVIAAMMDVVHTPRGTAAAIGRNLPYTIAGKTGTSQVISIAQDAVYDETGIDERHRNHGWFIAFAPVDRPRIAVAVLAENGGGSSAAYPVARAVMDAWLAEGDSDV